MVSSIHFADLNESIGKVFRFNQGAFDVNEERQTVEKDGLHYQCELRIGKFFIVNVLAFSVPVGNVLSAVPDLVG